MLTPQKIDSRRLIVVPGNTKETILYATNHFLECADIAIQEHGAFYVALSGGSTPKAIYALLSQPPFSVSIDWTKVHLFWSDERSVPPDSPESNYHMALEAGLKTLPIPPKQIHRMVAETDIKTNAAAYDTLIKDIHFDLIMLGMGDDGHTASLFPTTAGLNETKRRVIANHVPQHNTWRMTFTFPTINKGKNIAVYVIGEKKKERLKAVLHPSKDDTYPLQNVGTDTHRALFIVDDAAASQLAL